MHYLSLLRCDMWLGLVCLGFMIIITFSKESESHQLNGSELACQTIRFQGIQNRQDLQ
jgi:hypothetical protein